jgi:hypothetical protein
MGVEQKWKDEYQIGVVYFMHANFVSATDFIENP